MIWLINSITDPLRNTCMIGIICIIYIRSLHPPFPFPLEEEDDELLEDCLSLASFCKSWPNFPLLLIAAPPPIVSIVKPALNSTFPATIPSISPAALGSFSIALVATLSPITASIALSPVNAPAPVPRIPIIALRVFFSSAFNSSGVFLFHKGIQQ